MTTMTIKCGENIFIYLLKKMTTLSFIDTEAKKNKKALIV